MQSWHLVSFQRQEVQKPNRSRVAMRAPSRADVVTAVSLCCCRPRQHSPLGHLLGNPTWELFFEFKIGSNVFL